MNTAGYPKPNGLLLSSPQPRLTPKSDFLLLLERRQVEQRRQQPTRGSVTRLRKQAE